MSLVNVRNCIRFYQTAEELNASTLMNYCAEIIASHWVSERLGGMDRAFTLAACDPRVSPAFCSRLSNTSSLLLAVLKNKQLD